MASSSTVINEEITSTLSNAENHSGPVINQRSCANSNVFEEPDSIEHAETNHSSVVENLSRNFVQGERYENDADDFVFDSKCDEFLKSLQLSPAQIQSLERETVGQSENQVWKMERRKRLTASNFFRVFELEDEEPRSSLVETLLSPNNCFVNEAMNYGRNNEPNAIATYQNRTNEIVTKCGLFVHPEFGYLAASPDGLIGDDGLIEVTCPYLAQFSAPVTVPKYLAGPRSSIKHEKEMVRVNADSDHNYCFPILREVYKEIDLSKSKLTLKKNHKYYYQIQGQLEITGRKFCDFVVWTPHGILHLERIWRDTNGWKRMFPKLETFYKLSMLPEIVDPRSARGLPIREPDFVLEAMETCDDDFNEFYNNFYRRRKRRNGMSLNIFY